VYTTHNTSKHSLEGVYSTACYTMFTTRMSCVYVAELPCRENPCKNGGTCQANGNSYTCECVQPFHGTNCEQCKYTVSITHCTFRRKSSGNNRPTFMCLFLM